MLWRAHKRLQQTVSIQLDTVPYPPSSQLPILARLTRSILARSRLSLLSRHETATVQLLELEDMTGARFCAYPAQAFTALSTRRIPKSKENGRIVQLAVLQKTTGADISEW